MRDASSHSWKMIVFAFENILCYSWPVNSSPLNSHTKRDSARIDTTLFLNVVGEYGARVVFAPTSNDAEKEEYPNPISG